MIVLIYRKFNEEQFLLETFFTKMYIERDIHKKLIFFKFILGVKTPIKKSSWWGSGRFNMLFRTLKGVMPGADDSSAPFVWFTEAAC